MKYYRNVSEMIGKTPLLRLGKLAPAHQIYAKYEFMNPLFVDGLFDEAGER